MTDKGKQWSDSVPIKTSRSRIHSRPCLLNAGCGLVVMMMLLKVCRVGGCRPAVRQLAACSVPGRRAGEAHRPRGSRQTEAAEILWIFCISIAFLSRGCVSPCCLLLLRCLSLLKRCLLVLARDMIRAVAMRTLSLWIFCLFLLFFKSQIEFKSSFATPACATRRERLQPRHKVNSQGPQPSCFFEMFFCKLDFFCKSEMFCG